MVSYGRTTRMVRPKKDGGATTDSSSVQVTGNRCANRLGGEDLVHLRLPVGGSRALESPTSRIPPLWDGGSGDRNAKVVDRLR